VLSLVHEDGDDRLVCNVGHGFSIESLLEAKEDELEKTMWSSLALLAHVEMAIQKLLEQPERTDRARQESLHTRIAQARLHAEQLRAMIEETRRPNLSFLIQ
jgi:hypothetical protein